MTDKTAMNSASVKRTILRIVNEILERNNGASDIVIIGVRTRGVHIAERIASAIEKLEGIRPPLGTLDITLYRDDLRQKTEWPKVKRTEIPFSVEDKKVILVDDVLYTGRTTRAAIEAIMDFGRPSAIQLAALIDRGHRELPIQPDYIGHKIETARTQEVRVLLKETDGKDEVLLVQD
ncbi:MAG: bifunctional pyr operon transcriptional regulator/uracil phosphoribosyltransferase PyrR [Deltaproteobacteria bacterium]